MSLVKSLLLCLLSVLTLSACQRAPETSADPAPRTAVTLLHFFTGALGRGMNTVASSFNLQATRYELKPALLDHESFKTGIQGNLKSGHPPDLYSNWAGARTAAIVADLEPLDDIWRQAKLDERFPADLVRAASVYQGHKYLIPLTRSNVGFFYNKKLFATHRLKPPRTWDEFLAVCAALKAKGVTPIALGGKDRWPTQFWFDLLLLRTAPLEFRERLMRGQARYDDPRVLAVFARWATLLDKGYFNPDASQLTWYQGASQMVFKGSAAMTLMGSWGVEYFNHEAHHWVAGTDYDVFAFPRIRDDVPQVSLASVDGLVLPRKAVNKPGAKEVMAYLADKAAQQAFIRDSGALSPNTQVPRSAYNVIQRQLLVNTENQRQAFLFDLATPHDVAEMGLDAFAEFLALPKAYPRILNQLAQGAAVYFRSNPQP